MLSWHGAQLKAQGQLYFTYFTFLEFIINKKKVIINIYV
jgi:hypothetical protein